MIIFLLMLDPTAVWMLENEVRRSINLTPEKPHLYCDTNINLKQAEKKMLGKLFSELGIVGKYSILVSFGNFPIVRAKGIQLESKMILKSHSELYSFPR